MRESMPTRQQIIRCSTLFIKRFEYLCDPTTWKLPLSIIYQGNVLKIISSLINNPQTNTCFYKVKSNAGIAGNEWADAIAKYEANQANKSMADTGIPGAGPGGNPFPKLFWLAKEEKREPTASTSTTPAPNPTITYLPNLQNAL
eukprot:531093-Pelagomonas_calceolata.AAC.1